MSTVVALSEFREVLGASSGRRGDSRSPFGLSLPAAGAKDAPHLSPSIFSEICSGGGNGNAVRALRRMAIAGARAVFLDAGIGVLPAVTAKMGAARVIAFERDPERVSVARRLLAANHLRAEVIHGQGVIGATKGAPSSAPRFDLKLILDEERIDTLVVMLGATEPRSLRTLPAMVSHVLIAGDVAGECSAARDLMISCLIGGGYSFDPNASEGDAISFRRRDQRDSRRAG